MSQIRLSLFLMLFCVCSTFPSENLGVEELIRGVNQARLAIENGEVQYLHHYNYSAQKEEKEIAAWMQAEKKEALKAFAPDPSLPDIGLKEFEEEYLIPVLNYRANRERARMDIEKVSMAFQILVPDAMNFPTLYQYKMTVEEQPGINLESQAARFPQPGLFYHLSYDTHLQVKEDIGDIVLPGHGVRSWDSDEYVGFHHLWAFGRSAHRVPDSAKYVGKEQVEGVECYVLAFELEDRSHRQIWIDPEKAFCIRRYERKKTLGASVVKDTAEYKQFQRFGDVWYPTVIRFTQYNEKGVIQRSNGFQIFSAVFNVNFSKDFFKIDGDFFLGLEPRTKDMGTPGLGAFDSSSPTHADELLLHCGPRSLLKICELLKVTTNLRELKKLSRFNPTRGTTMLGLKKAATYKGLAPTGVRAPLKLLKKKKVPLPAIAYVEGNHFLVFEAVNNSGVKISDPAHKYSSHLAWDKLAAIWNGELLIFDKKKVHTQKQEPVPLAFAETPEYNFGKVLGGSQISHTFMIKNIGQKPLKILSVTETCACTASVLTQDEIPPESTGSISTVLTVPSGNVEVQESLLVLTDDPTQRTLTLTLKGQAFIPLTTFPQRLALGNQKPLQAPLTKRVSLHLQDDVQILSVRTDSEHLEATLETVNDIPYVELQLLPTLPVGQFSHNLLVDYTYQGQQTTHNLIVFGQILGDLHVAPSRLFFGLIKEPGTFSKTITISARDTQPFKITSVESRTKGIVFKIAADESERRAQVTVSIARTTKPGELSGDIVIHTSSTIQPTLQVPFFGILAETN